MSGQNICRIFFTKPKPGAEKQLEEARKKHFEFHKQHADTWHWNTYIIETGQNTGTMVVSTCGHSWKDFDEWEAKMGEADRADALAGMGPLEASSWNSFYEVREDLSSAPANTMEPMVTVNIYTLHAGASGEFAEGIKKIREVMMKQPKRPGSVTWMELANGGDGPTFVRLGGLQGFADRAPNGKPSRELVADALGKEAADNLYKSIGSTIDHSYSETAIYRPDLSYPAK